MDKMNPLNHPICFATPDHLQSSYLQISSWTEHAPFGMFLIDLIRPNIFVELGTHTGFSYCCFCQAVLQFGLNTLCFAVDTWLGDDHAGYYGPEVLAELRGYHDPLYGRFSSLVQSTFDEAVDYFTDDSIDLLHIDGCHTYEAVKHDFETWLPKLSNRGIVLFHDTNVRERNFGVWKLWLELIQRYPGFEFFHGYGLGVLAVGRDALTALERLILLPENRKQSLRRFFSYLGSKLTLEIQRKKEVDSFQQQIVERDRKSENLQRHLDELSQVQGTLSRRELEYEQLQGTLFRRELELREAKKILSQYSGRLQEYGMQLQDLRNKAHRVSQELESFRNRRMIRWMNRISKPSDLSNDISPAFQQLKDDSLIFTKKLKGYRLQISINLQQVPFLQYQLDLDRPNLKGILLAPVLDLPLLQGLLAIEIVSPSNAIVTQGFIQVVQISESEPTRFEFPPIQDSDQGRFWLRVFVREVDGPVRIFEWRKYAAFGLGPMQTRGFCGFLFEDTH